MDAAFGVAARLQVFDGVLRTPVLDEQVQGMTDEKRVVRAGVANIGVLLQAQLQRTALLSEAIGKGLANRVAKRWQGVGRERCQCSRCADRGDQRNASAPGCRGSRPPA